MRIAFYAPMKPPTHPTPSGDRTIARSVMSLLGDIGEVDLASTLRMRDGQGDAARQADLASAADKEVERLSGGHWDAWVTYHNYYKAPDMIGPVVARRKGLPYVLIEATRASKRRVGPWARFAAAAEAACDAADVILYFTEQDREALERDQRPGQRIAPLRPFLDVETLPPAKAPVAKGNLLAVGMMREGDKLASYRSLAKALALTTVRLEIVGDGPARVAVEQLFAPFGDRVRFVGELDREGVAARMRAASALVWPGVNEAFGMVYLEAQALGLRCIAEDRPGVRDVVGPTGVLCPADDPAGFAQAIRDLPQETADTIAATRTAMAPHLRGAARSVLASALGVRS